MAMKVLRLGLVLLLIGTVPAMAQTRPASPPPAASGSLIDLNSASRDDLMSLDGVGEVRADAIIRSRPFKAKTELVERRLMPEALYDKISDKVMARPVAAAPAAPGPRPAAPAQPRR
jgi:DNA uptake protein ComE-like DNA-binding protein